MRLVYSVDFRHINDLVDLKFTLANDVYIHTLVSLAAHNRASLILLLTDSMVQVFVYHNARKRLKKRNLHKEFFLLFRFAPGNYVQHRLVVVFAHHCKFALAATDDRRCTRLRLILHFFVLVFLHGKFTKWFALTYAQNRNQKFVIFAPC